jgi:hypothetical protein
MEKISWTDSVKNEVLQRAEGERNVPQKKIKRRKANWIGHILRRNGLLKCIIEEKIEGRVEVAGRRGRKRKQLLDDLKETRGYWKWKKRSTRSQFVENLLWKRQWTCFLGTQQDE